MKPPRGNYVTSSKNFRLFVQKHPKHFVVSRGKGAKRECVIKLSFRTLMWTAMFQTISEHVKARIVCVVLGISSIIINHRFDKLVLTIATSWHRTAPITDSLCAGGRLIWPMIRTLGDIFIVSPSKLLNTQSSWGDLKHHDVHVSSPKYYTRNAIYVYVYTLYILVFHGFHCFTFCRVAGDLRGHKSHVMSLYHRILHARGTVEYRYNAVQYDMILCTVLQWLRQNMNQRFYPQKTPHISPSRASYVVSVVRIREKTGRVITLRTLFLLFDLINTLRPVQNGRHFPGDIFKWFY